jgi:4-hydroxy-2-oxoheptanedioate aldolase
MAGTPQNDLMRVSKVLTKIRSGQIARVCSGSNFIPYLPHLAAHFDYDGVWMDAEHRNWNPREIETMLAQHRLADIDCIWRPPTIEKAALARLLEDGATGLMIPQVNTAQRAQELVAAVKFPPLGDRGLDGAGMDAGFWVKRTPDYPERANQETFLLAQIETPLAVENVESIAAVPGVDLLFMGPGDLSLRLGCTASLEDPKMRAALNQMIEACKRHQKPWGYPTGNIEDAKIIVDLGARFLVLGGELAAIQNHFQSCSEKLNRLLGQPA